VPLHEGAEQVDPVGRRQFPPDFGADARLLPAVDQQGAGRKGNFGAIGEADRARRVGASGDGVQNIGGLGDQVVQVAVVGGPGDGFDYPVGQAHLLQQRFFGAARYGEQRPGHEQSEVAGQDIVRVGRVQRFPGDQVVVEPRSSRLSSSVTSCS
jgi:hypothetical protein